MQGSAMRFHGRSGRAISLWLAGEIVADDLENRRAQQAVVREPRVLDLGEQRRLDPRGLRLLYRDCERRALADQRLEALAQLARGHFRVAAASFSRIEQLFILPAPEIKRRNFARPRRELLDECDD